MAFMVFFLSVVLVLCLLLLTTPNVLDALFWTKTESIVILITSILLLTFGGLPLLKMKKIQVESDRILFQNYLFPYIIKEVSFKKYEFYKIVHEESENGTFEAVWLIKDGKLADSFSTYHYLNYDALKSAINLKFKGELHLSPIKQLQCRFGMKI